MTRFMTRWSGCACALALLAACDPQPGTDAGRDAGAADVPSSDVPLAPSDAAPDADELDAPLVAPCEADETRLRGVCIATCDGLDGFDAALAAGVVPVAHACRAPGAFDAVGTNVYELEAIPGSDGSTTLRLVRWAMASGAVTPSTLAQRVYVPTMDPREAVYPGFVAVSEDGAHALFGYTTGTSDFAGGVVNVRTGAMTFDEVDANGNFDAAFISGSQYLVNGLNFEALDGQALYLADAAETAPAGRTVATNMGAYSGSVALWGAEDLVVFAGALFGAPWPDGSLTSGYVFVLPLEGVMGTPSPIDTFAEAQRLELPGSFELLPDGRLVEAYYGASGIDGIRYYQLAHGASAVTAGSAVDISTGGTFTNASAIEGDVLLVHATGALRVTLP